MFGRRRFLGAALGGPALPVFAAGPVAGQNPDRFPEGQAFYADYDAAARSEADDAGPALSILTGDGERLDYTPATADTVRPPLVTAAGRRWMPANGVLDIRHCASASDLASDFAGVFTQAMDDALANGWELRIPGGAWETRPIDYRAPGAGRLHIDFAPGARLIGPSHFQHFPGDGKTRSFRLDAWGSADTDGLTAMIVDADNGYTILRPDAPKGFSRKGAVLSLNADCPTLRLGETLVVSSRASILSISGENGDFSLRLRGGHFDNGRMGHVVSQASGGCVALTTIRDLYWDGGPVFENSSKQSVFAKSLLDIRGDSGLVLGNVERASIYGAQFLYQPDVGNYTTGLARGGRNAEEYHQDDGRFVTFFGAVAKGCGTGFRSARDGGGYGLYGCAVEEGHSGFLSANVSAGLPAARNIQIHGLTCRKITYDVLDVRDTRSLVLSGLTVEDWGRNLDGSLPKRRLALMSFGTVKHLDARGIRCTYEEWLPPDDPAPVMTFANGLTCNARIAASIELPHQAIGTGARGVWISGGLGSEGDLKIELVATNVDAPVVFGKDHPLPFVKAEITSNRRAQDGSFSTEHYNIANGQRIAETHGVPFETIGGFTPELAPARRAAPGFAMLPSSEGTYTQQGHLVRVFVRARARCPWAQLAPDLALRLALPDTGTLPPVGRMLEARIDTWRIGTAAAGGQSLRLDGTAGTDGGSALLLSPAQEGAAAPWEDGAEVELHLDLTFSYIPDGVLP